MSLQVKEQLNQWLVHSRNYLNEAKVIGFNANLILKRLKTLLDANNLLVLKINYLIMFLKDQIDLMNNIFKCLSDFNKRFQLKFLQNLNFLGNLINQLNDCLTSLNSILIDNNLKAFINKENHVVTKNLDNININNSNGDEDNQEEVKSLYDYLSLEEFLKIQQNFEILSDNFPLLNDYLIKNQLKFFEINLINFDNFFQNLINQFTNINNYYYKDLTDLNLYSNDNSNPNLGSNEKFSILVNYYEFEMASLLQSLTHHYDQCNEAHQLFNTNQQQQLQQLLLILADDSLEAPNVLSDLKLLFVKIDTLNKNDNLSNLNANLNKVYNDLIVNNFIVNDFLQKTNKNLNIESTAVQLNKLNFNFLKRKELKLNDELNIINLDLIGNIGLITNFISFLKSFEKTYFELILEIDRNVNVNNKVKKLINNFFTKLNAIETESLHINNKVNKNINHFLPTDLSSIVNKRLLPAHQKLANVMLTNNTDPTFATEDITGSPAVIKNHNNLSNKISNANGCLPIVEIISQFGEYPKLDQSLIEFAKLKLSNKLDK